MNRFRAGNRFLGGGSQGNDDVLFKVFLGSIALMIAGFIYLLWTGQGRETWLVVSGTLPFYCITALIVVGGIVCWYKNENFTGGELGLFVGIAVPCSYVTLALAFLWLTDLGHNVVWNSKVRSVVWTEAYINKAKEKKDSDKRHSATYVISTAANESISTTKEVWLAYVTRFGGQEKVASRRNVSADKEDWGSGSNGNGTPEIHTITWDGRKETEVPTSNEHIEANYVQAADTSLRVSGVKEKFRDYLAPYPRVTAGVYGKVYFDRVIESRTTVDGTFHQLVDIRLDEALQTLWSQKQCNIVIYLVGTEDVGFFQALREHWKEGKKNDICVCVGYTQNKIHWCKVMTYTDHTRFVENLERDVRHLDTLTDKGDQFVETILRNITAPGDSGYLRKPMADFEFLAADVRMVWYVQLLAFVCAGVWLMPTVAICVRD